MTVIVDVAYAGDLADLFGPYHLSYRVISADGPEVEVFGPDDNVRKFLETEGYDPFSYIVVES